MDTWLKSSIPLAPLANQNLSASIYRQMAPADGVVSFFFCLIFRPVDLPSCLSISATLTNNSCLFCVCLFSEQLPPRPAVTTAPPHHRFDSLLIVRTKSLMTYSGWSKWISVRSTKMNEFDLHSFQFISFIF